MSGTEVGNMKCGEGLTARSGFLAVVRIALGALFLFAGATKLRDIDFFAYSVKGFQLGMSEDVVNVVAHVVPWAEVTAGVLLILGLWARGAALIVVLMMVAFAGGIASVMARGLDVKCGCFGALKLFCGDQPMGWCHLIRNAVMGGAGVLIVAMGPGVLAGDNCRRETPKGVRTEPTA